MIYRFSVPAAFYFDVVADSEEEGREKAEAVCERVDGWDCLSEVQDYSDGEIPDRDQFSGGVTYPVRFAEGDDKDRWCLQLEEVAEEIEGTRE